jgi:hypothetical protein
VKRKETIFAQEIVLVSLKCYGSFHFSLYQYLAHPGVNGNSSCILIHELAKVD